MIPKCTVFAAAVGLVATGVVSAVRVKSFTDYQSTDSDYQRALASPDHPEHGFGALARGLEREGACAEGRIALRSTLGALIGEELCKERKDYPFLDALAALESVSGELEPETQPWRAFLHDQVWGVVEGQAQFPVEQLPDRWSYPVSGLWEWVERGVWEYRGGAPQTGAAAVTGFRRLSVHLNWSQRVAEHEAQVYQEEADTLRKAYEGEVQFAMIVARLYRKALRLGEGGDRAGQDAEVAGCVQLLRFLQHLSVRTGDASFGRAADQAVDLLLAGGNSDSAPLLEGAGRFSPGGTSTPEFLDYIRGRAGNKASSGAEKRKVGETEDSGSAKRARTAGDAAQTEEGSAKRARTAGGAVNNPVDEAAADDSEVSDPSLYRSARDLVLDDVFSVDARYWRGAKASMQKKAPSLSESDLNDWIQGRKTRVPEETAFKVVATHPDGRMDAIKTSDAFNLEARTGAYNAACVSFEPESVLKFMRAGGRSGKGANGVRDGRNLPLRRQRPGGLRS